MPGVICLQGGGEFTQRCREMDIAVLRRAAAGSTGRPVAVLAGAARPGRDHDGAVRRARTHYESLGACVTAIPDPRIDVDATLEALSADIGVLVLPGGSPASLADVLLGSTPQVGDRIVERYEQGMSVSGASAGAMVLAEHCILPEASRRRRTTVTHGLNLVEGVVLPHWQPGPGRWPLPDEVNLWGLPECGGVLVGDDGSTEALGHGTPSFRLGGAGWLPVMRATPPGRVAALAGE